MSKISVRHRKIHSFGNDQYQIRNSPIFLNWAISYRL